MTFGGLYAPWESIWPLVGVTLDFVVKICAINWFYFYNTQNILTIFYMQFSIIFNNKNIMDFFKKHSIAKRARPC